MEVLDRFALRLRNRYRRSLAEAIACRPAHLAQHRPIISFTFDDFPQSALKIGGSILKSRGLLGTYYASLGMMDMETSPVGTIFTRSDLLETFHQGHELGCHTFDHLNAWETTAPAFENSILENSKTLQRLLPEACFKTFSYPKTDPHPRVKRRIGSRFQCCRGGGQTFNRERVDLNNLKSFFLEQSAGDFDVVKDIIDRNAIAVGWLIFATHDICDRPTRFGCTGEFFKSTVEYSIKSGSQVLPVGTALDLLMKPAQK